MTVNYRTFVVANPRAAAGAVKEEWGIIERLLRAQIPEFDYAFTEGPGHATLLTREALRAGWEMVVAIGGDGTLNEVVNGFYEKPDPNSAYSLSDDQWIVKNDLTLIPIQPNAVLGVIPLGTGGDFRRSIGFMGGLAESIEHLSGRDTRAIDLGQVGYLDHKGRVATRFFLNVAGAGIAGDIDAQTNKQWKGLGGKPSFVLGSLRAVMGWHNVDMDIRLDDTYEDRERLLTLVVANGEYFGAGMWVAPGAQLDDGQFQVIFIGDFSKSEALQLLPAIYRGQHLGMRKVYRRRAKQISVRAVSEKKPVLLDLDGEQPGQLPATWNIHPGAINLKI